MWITILSGISMIVLNPALLSQNWMIAKLFMLSLLIAYSFSLDYYRKQLENNSCKKVENSLECIMSNQLYLLF